MAPQFRIFCWLLVFTGSLNLNAQTCPACTDPVPLNSGLVFCVPFDISQADQSTNHFPGMPVNSPGYVVDRFGNPNRACFFDGSTQLTRYGDILDNVFCATPTAKFTVTGWAKTSSINSVFGAGLIVAKQAGGSGPDEWSVSHFNDGTVRGIVKTSPLTDYVEWKSPAVIPLNQWFFFAMTFDGSVAAPANRVQITVNGVAGVFSRSNGTFANSCANTVQEVTIGSGHQAGSPTTPVNQYHGAVDDIRIYNRVLSAAEIAELYNPTVNPLTPMADRFICRGDSVQLSASPGTTYAWSPATGLNSTTIRNPVAKPSSTTQYIVTVSNGSSCPMRDTVFVYVNPGCCVGPSPANTSLWFAAPITGDASDITPGPMSPVLSGTPAFAPDRFANANSAYDFANATDRISYSSATKMNFPPSQSFSICGWVKLRSIRPSPGYLADIFENNMLEMYVGGTTTPATAGKIVFTDFNSASSSNRVQLVSPAPLSLNGWHHVATSVNKSDSMNILYVDGMKVASAKAVNSSFANCALTMGNHPTNPWAPDGAIDDLRVYAKALDSTEVFSMYNNGRVTILTPDSSICAGESIQVTTAGFAGAYSWSPAAGVSNPSSANPLLTPAASTTYILTASNSQCTWYDTIKVTVNGLAPKDITDKSICKGDSIQLTAAGGASYKWFPSAGLSDSLSAAPLAFPSASEKYAVLVSSGKCFYRDTVNVFVVTDCCVDCRDPFSLNAGLIGCYPLNGTALDESGNSWHGSLGTGVSPAVDRRTDAGKSYSFNSTPDAFISVPPSAALNAAASKNLSMACWFYPNAAPPPFPIRTLINLQDPSGRKHELSYDYTGGRIQYVNSNGSWASVTMTSLTRLAANEWHHAGVTIDSANNVYLYINGVKENQTAILVSRPVNPSLLIGAQPLNNVNFSGSVDDVRLYARVLTAQDMKELMPVGKARPLQPFVTSPDTTICYGDTALLRSSPAMHNIWSPDLYLSDDSAASPVAAPPVTIRYALTATTGLCAGSDSVLITVVKVNAGAGPDFSICPGDSVQLVASGGTSYAWNFDTSLTDTAISKPWAKPSATTSYVVTVSDNQCEARDTATVNIVSFITVTTGNDTSICRGDTLALTAAGGTAYSWKPATELSSPFSASTKAWPAVTTAYTVTGTSAACSDDDTVLVIVNPPPVVSLGPDTFMCANVPFTFFPAVTGINKYAWSPGTALSDSTVQRPSIIAQVVSDYTLTVTDSLTGCKATDDVRVEYRRPQAFFHLDAYESASPPLTVHVHNVSHPGPLSWQWNINDSAFYMDENPAHTFHAPGDYSLLLKVTDEKGCTDTFSRRLHVFDEDFIIIPNVFTPNGDGTNDRFEVLTKPGSVKSVSGTIWNRWGGEMYSFSIPGDEWWDGKARGDAASEGVYFYVLTVVARSGKTTHHHGTVTIFR